MYQKVLSIHSGMIIIEPYTAVQIIPKSYTQRYDKYYYTYQYRYVYSKLTKWYTQRYLGFAFTVYTAVFSFQCVNTLI